MQNSDSDQVFTFVVVILLPFFPIQWVFFFNWILRSMSFFILAIPIDDHKYFFYIFIQCFQCFDMFFFIFSCFYTHHPNLHPASTLSNEFFWKLILCESETTRPYQGLDKRKLKSDGYILRNLNFSIVFFFWIVTIPNWSNFARACRDVLLYKPVLLKPFLQTILRLAILKT